MLKEIIIIILLTLTPGLELRASIPYGILIAHLNWFFVLAFSIIVNALIAPLVYYFLTYFMRFLLRYKRFKKFWKGQIERVQNKIKPSLEKYGEWGLAIFIGIPLPGTGVYTGAIAAYILGMDFKRLLWGSIAGVLIAGTIVAFVVWSGSQAFSLFVKMV